MIKLRLLRATAGTGRNGTFSRPRGSIREYPDGVALAKVEANLAEPATDEDAKKIDALRKSSARAVSPGVRRAVDARRPETRTSSPSVEDDESDDDEALTDDPPPAAPPAKPPKKKAGAK